ncbi:MAG: hypothetical protein QOD06_3028 [Candidatus Binatota bacterium]|jgi:EpsI family protein|nr:hypothetical protein [Candidatus Binatota bacterium]
MTGSRRFAASAGVLLFTFVLLRFFDESEAVPLRKPLASFPDRIAEWRGRETTLFSEDVLDVLRPTDYLMRRYQHPSGASLWLYIGYWATQRKGAQVHSPKNCLPGGGWEPLEASRVQLPVEPSGTIDANEYLLQNGAEQQLVVYWYQSRGETTASEIGGKIALVRNAILHHRTDAAVIRVSTVELGGTAKAMSPLLRGFVRALHPRLPEFLPG